MELKAGYKKTEIGVIPEDWEVKELGLVGEIATGTTPPTNNRNNYGDEYLFVSPADLGKGKYIIDTEKKISKLGYSIARKYPANSILFTCIGSTIGKSGISQIELTSNQQINAVFPNDTFSSDFVFYYLNFISPKIKLGASEQAVPMINKTAFSKTKIILPTKAEQTAIATALSDADALINSLEKLIAKKRNISKGAMQKLLKPKADWVIKKFGEVLKVKHGKSQKQIEDINGKYPILGTGGLMGFTNHFLYNKPSVLIGRKGTIDKPQFMETPFWTVDTLFYTEIFEGYSAKFIFYVFNLIDWYSYNEASGVPSLNAKTIEKIERGFPPLEIQTRIATILSDMDAEISSLEAKLEKYRKVKLGMMQNLLTGKIRLV